MKEYIPKPVDTSSVELSEEIQALAESLAKNTHEVWSQGKLAEGWVYGETIDPQKKTHSSLVEYEALSESQKDYDRRTSMEALKFVIASGFMIVRK